MLSSFKKKIKKNKIACSLYFLLPAWKKEPKIADTFPLFFHPILFHYF
jgi:hypothetical protein